MGQVQIISTDWVSQDEISLDVQIRYSTDWVHSDNIIAN